LSEAVYGSPPVALAVVGAGAVQISPLVPGAAALETLADQSFDRIVVSAPPGTVERRYVLAQALRALEPGGELVALALKDRGGMRLRGDLEAFGCAVIENARRHHRIVTSVSPVAPTGLAAAIVDGGPQLAPGLDLWSQPGVFSWDRLDRGTALLLETLTPMAGRGADLGCGIGLIGRELLKSPDVTGLLLIDIDARAMAAARRNIDDPRAIFEHGDVRRHACADLDFAVMNPPFHDAGREDRALGQAFIGAAASRLKPGGVCRMVANIGLPYEAVLQACFSKVTLLAQARGYKVHEARK
jgi:16S rRNA (guanine1207-N2)-methyltransferase